MRCTLEAQEVQKSGVDPSSRASLDFRPMSNGFFLLAPTTAGRVRLSFNQAADLQTCPTHMREEHTSPAAGAYHRAHVFLGCEERSRMYDFWLGVLASLAVLVFTLAYRSHIRGDTCGTSVLSRRPLWFCDTQAQACRVCAVCSHSQADQSLWQRPTETWPVQVELTQQSTKSERRRAARWHSQVLE
jgi:hypothetical protein